MFFDMYKNACSESVFNTLYIEKKHKVRLSRTVCKIFHFPLHFVFVKVHIFVQ